VIKNIISGAFIGIANIIPEVSGRAMVISGIFGSLLLVMLGENYNIL